MTSLAMTGTFSKSQKAWGLPDDLKVVSGDGAYVIMTNGARYLDWVSGLGTNLFGYGYFYDRIEKELFGGGGSHSLPHYLEYEAADLLTKMLSENIPHWNDANLQARFSLSGTDAVSAAVRLARAVTVSDGIICVNGGYHGWADWTIARTEPAAGIPRCVSESVANFQFNNLETLEGAGQWLGGVAAVVIEQGLVEPEPHFYKSVRQFCDRHNALLIMDEIVTGLRYGLGGVCGLYDIEPDLVCMGKALGNGLPVSALIGYQELMSEFDKVSPVFCSSTHWGNSLNMAAVKAVLENWTPARVEYITCIGDQLMKGLKAAGWDVVGHPQRSLIKFDSGYQHAAFVQGMFDEYVLMNRPNFPTLAHQETDIDQTVIAANRAMQKYKCMLERGVEIATEQMPRILFSDR